MTINVKHAGKDFFKSVIISGPSLRTSVNLNSMFAVEGFTLVRNLTGIQNVLSLSQIHKP